ncbi:hypothetical protein [Thioclava sp. GXIMD4216]|uniref:DUF2568 domain-containing protein n=1 Tax=Thioclava litoralis TaxID=3076557 RepID=A0ABZ1E3F7_9RHOB|nr:hypothetical protein RPE78_04975 [Thioclava sp. FTW29]
MQYIPQARELALGLFTAIFAMIIFQAARGAGTLAPPELLLLSAAGACALRGFIANLREGCQPPLRADCLRTTVICAALTLKLLWAEFALTQSDGTMMAASLAAIIMALAHNLICQSRGAMRRS